MSLFIVPISRTVRYTLSFFMMLFCVFSLDAQSTFSINSSTATSISGDITSAPSTTYTLTRTFQNGFTGTVNFNLGTTSGVQGKNGFKTGNNMGNPDEFRYNFSITPDAFCTVNSIIVKRIAVNGQGGTGECTGFTVSWPGGGSAIINDPGNEFTSHNDGDLFVSGTVLSYQPGPSFNSPCNNLTNAGQQWSFVIPSTSVTLNAMALAPGPSDPQDMMFSEWIAFDADIICSALPVEFLNFSAKCDDQKVRLNWQTSSEINNDYFTVERSRDGIIFDVISTVLGHGNSTVSQTYNWRDNNPLSGISYYRLSQTDYDGSQEFLKTISIDCMQEEVVKLYPNPFENSLTISSQHRGILTLYDISGKVIQQMSFEAGVQSRAMYEIANGIYIAHVLLSNGEIEDIKLFKQ